MAEQSLSDLEELLQREVGLGTFDSTGTFTLSLAEARRKLQQFQLTSLEQAVLKLIQGAVRLEPAAIWMESTDRGFTIYWADPKEELQAQHFAGEFERVLLGPDSSAKDIAIGLMGFLDKEPAQVWWAQWHGSEIVETVSLFGGQKQAHLHSPPDVHQRTFALALEAGSQKLRVDRQVVATRTLFAPVLILWNGRLLCELSWNPPGHTPAQGPYWADFYFQTSGPLARGLALKPIGPCRRQVLSAPAFSGDFPEARSYTVQSRYILGPQSRGLTLRGRKPNLSRLQNLLTPGNAAGYPVELVTSLGESIWVVSGQQTAPAVLLCVKNGVMLDPCTLPKQMGGTVAVLACPDLEVDLSQFAPIVDSPSWQALGRRVRDQAQVVVEHISRNPPSTLGDVANLGGTWGFAAITGGLFGAVLLPVPGLVGGLVGGLGSFLVAKSFDDTRLRRRIAALRTAVGVRDANL